MIHTSEAITYEKFDYYTKFMHDILYDADIDSGNVRVGVVNYNREAKIVFPLDRYLTANAVWRAVMTLPLEQNADANLADGLDQVLEQVFSPSGGDRPDAPNAVIVVTDAESNIDGDKIERYAQRLRHESGARIYTTGIGLKGMSQLQTVATAPGYSFAAGSVEELPSVASSIVQQSSGCKAKHQHDRPKTCTASTGTLSGINVVLFNLTAILSMIIN